MVESFPLQISDFKDESGCWIDGEEFVQVGPKKYFIRTSFKQHCDQLYNFDQRRDDIWLFGLARCGTTLTQEIVWLITNDFDYKTASKQRLDIRFPFFENCLYVNLFHSIMRPIFKCYSWWLMNNLVTTKERRLIKTHLPMSMFSEGLWMSGCKIIYCFRDPRDVIVSTFHYYQFSYNNRIKVDFKGFWEVFKNGYVQYLPYFEHVKEGWAKRNNKNVLLLRYEDTLKNKRETIKKIATFLEKELTEEQIDKLEDYTSHANFKKNKSINYEDFRYLGFYESEKNSFIRKGKAGQWKEYFTGDLEKEVNDWIKENLKGTDLTF